MDAVEFYPVTHKWVLQYKTRSIHQQNSTPSMQIDNVVLVIDKLVIYTQHCMGAKFYNYNNNP